MLGAAISAGFGFYQVQEAINAQEKAEVAIKEKEKAEEQFKNVTNQLDKANKDLEKAEQSVKQAQEQETKAKKQTLVFAHKKKFGLKMEALLRIGKSSRKIGDNSTLM